MRETKQQRQDRARQAALDSIARQVREGRLIVRQATAEERDRLGIKPTAPTEGRGDAGA